MNLNHYMLLNFIETNQCSFYQILFVPYVEWRTLYNITPNHYVRVCHLRYPEMHQVVCDPWSTINDKGFNYNFQDLRPKYALYSPFPIHKAWWEWYQSQIALKVIQISGLCVCFTWYDMHSIFFGIQTKSIFIFECFIHCTCSKLSKRWGIKIMAVKLIEYDRIHTNSRYIYAWYQSAFI